MEVRGNFYLMKYIQLQMEAFMAKADFFKLFILACSALAGADSVGAGFSGGLDGGGGKGILCEPPAPGPALELLDLYEAKYAWGYQIPSLPEEEMARRIFERFHMLRFDHYQKALPYSEQNFQEDRKKYEAFVASLNPIPLGATLPLTNDGPSIIIPPPGCRVVQIISFLDEGQGSGRALVDKALWDLLDAQNKLALYFHETTYRKAREDGESRAGRAKKFIGTLFADRALPLMHIYNESAGKSVRCEGTDPGNHVVIFEVYDSPGTQDSYFGFYPMFGSTVLVDYSFPGPKVAKSWVRLESLIANTGYYGGSSDLELVGADGFQKLHLWIEDKCSADKFGECSKRIFLSKRDGSLKSEMMCYRGNGWDDSK